MQVFGVNSSLVTDFTQTARDAAQQAKLLYDISPLSTSTLMSFETNAEYLIEDKRNGLCTVLRISRPDFRTFDELYSEIKWIQELGKYNPPFVLPSPVAGIDGSYIQKLSLSSGGFCYCTMFDYLQGCPIKGHDETHLISDFKKLGEITALMHQCAIQWNSTENLNRSVLDCTTLIGSQARYGLWSSSVFDNDGKPALSNELNLLFDRTAGVIRRRLSQFGKGSARFGFIHSDLTLSNVICYKNRFAVTHFDNCGFGWFLYDFASSVSFLEDKPYLPKLMTAWLEGYRSIRNISNEEKFEIPTFIMMRRLELLSRLLNHRDYMPPDGYTEDFTDKTAALAEKYLAGYK